MSGWIKPEFLREDVGPGARGTLIAGGNIPAHSLVKFSSGKVVKAGVEDTAVIGISLESDAKILNDELDVLYVGEAEGLADVAISRGELVKVGTGGTVTPALSTDTDGVTISSAVTGIAFTNQPANDGIEIVSSSALDTMPVVVYGTTNGGTVVVKESVTLTGTTFASTVKTDWGVCLGFEIPDGYPTAVGTITVREASGNATISTLTSGNRRKGVTLVSSTAVRGFLHAPSAEASGSSTKVVGLVGTTSTGAELLDAVTLSGTTAVSFSTAARTVTKVLVGDLESSRTATFKTDTTLDSGNVIVGIALESVAAGALCRCLFTKVLPLQTLSTGAITLGDNLANAYDVKEGSNSYLKFVTTDSSEKVAVSKRLTVTDGVASGTAKVVGGMASANPAASTAVTGTTETETNFDNSTYPLPANTLKVGTKIRVRAGGLYTATTGTENHIFLVKAGSTTLAATGNIDPATNDMFDIDFEFICRAVGGSGTVVGTGVCRSGPRATAAPATHLLGTGSAATSTTTVDTTAANTLAIAVDRQSTATDSDSMRLDYCFWEIV